MTTPETTPIALPTNNIKSSADSFTDNDIESSCTDDTPRSCDSSESSSLTTPRGNLLWDHGYDVSDNDQNLKSFEEREAQWRKFNKTDDDKLQDDKLNDTETEATEGNTEEKILNIEMDVDINTCTALSNNLPDLVSSMSSSIGVQIYSSDESLGESDANDSLSNDNVTIYNKEIDSAIGIHVQNMMGQLIEDDLESPTTNISHSVVFQREPNVDVPPPLPASNPPTLETSESPPPLPQSNPPDIRTSIESLGETIANDSINHYHEVNSDSEIDVDKVSNNDDERKDNTSDTNYDDNNKVYDETNQMLDSLSNLFLELESVGTGDSDSNRKDQSPAMSGLLPMNQNIDIGNDQLEKELVSDSLLSHTALHAIEKDDTSITENDNVYTNQVSKERFDSDAEKAFDELMNTTEIVRSPGESETNREYKKCDAQEPEQKGQFDMEVEAEFEAIINALDLNYMDETYVERFADRRDRYGFILSPVVEAPSPTPSSLSGYSGLSSVSPDPLSMFRMSPRPGSRTDLDLSSLGIDPSDWDVNPDSPVPIYQTVQAKRAVVIPESYGWESGDDILSGSGEWEVDDGALKSPPISISAVNFSQFGSHVFGWKQSDSVIVEESESISDEDDQTDSDDTLHGDCEGHPEPQYVSEVKGDGDPLPRETFEDSDNDVDDELNSTLEDVLGELTEIAMLPTEESLDILNSGITEIEEEISSLRENNGRHSQEISKEPIDQNDLCKERKKQEDIFVSITNLETSSSDVSSLYHRTNSNTSVQTSECRSTPGDLDAEDEMSDTDDDDNHQMHGDEDSDSEVLQSTRESIELVLATANDKSKKDTEENVLVSELMSPRSAVLLLGGMFPLNEEESTSSSSLESDSDDEVNKTNEKICSIGKDIDPGIKVTQLTSEDSDIDELTTTNADVSVSQKPNNIVSFRGKYKPNSANCSPQEDMYRKATQEKEIDSASSTPTVNIISPLELEIFGGMIDRPSRNEGGRSPRVLGRHLSEMDEEVVAQSLSPPVVDTTIRGILPSNKEGYDTQIQPQTQTDWQAESEFKDIVFSHQSSSGAGVNEINNENEFSDDSSNESPEIPYPLIENTDQEKRLQSQDNTSVQEPDSTNGIEFEHQFVITSQTSRDKRKTPPVTKSINRRNAKLNQRKSPVQIKVSHLKRKDSLRSKIKKGFVHQLSEIFSKKNQREDQEVPIKSTERKSHQSSYATVCLPESLIPNDNIIISPRSPRVLELNDTEDLKGGSLGFEVSPLHIISEQGDTTTTSVTKQVNSSEQGMRCDEESSDDTDIETSDFLLINEVHIQPQTDLSGHIHEEDSQNEHTDNHVSDLFESSAESELKQYETLLKDLEIENENNAVQDQNNLGVRETISDSEIERSRETDKETSKQCDRKLESSITYVAKESPTQELTSNGTYFSTSSDKESDYFGLYKKWTRPKSIKACGDIPHEESFLSFKNKKDKELESGFTEESNDKVVSTCKNEFVEEKSGEGHVVLNEDSTGILTRPFQCNAEQSKEDRAMSARKRFSLDEQKEFVNKTQKYSNDPDKIQYPPSLSRRLYGPYLRQQQRSPQPNNTQSSNEREITPETLSRNTYLSPYSTEIDRCKTLNAILTVSSVDNTDLTNNSKYSNSQERQQDDRLNNVQSSWLMTKGNECINSLPSQNYSKLDADKTTKECPGQNVNLRYRGDVFQHTLYKVDLPITTTPTLGNVPFNVKPINHCVGDDARHLYHSENNFANANIRSSDWSWDVNTDVNNDNIQPSRSSSKVTKCCDGKPVEIFVNDKSQNTLDFVHESNSLTCDGGLSVECGLKNGMFREKVGVFASREITSNDDTHENGKMKGNGPLLQATTAESKVNSLSINDPVSPSTATVNQAYMSSGKDVSHGVNSQPHGKNVPSGWTSDKQVSVVILPPDCKHVLEDEKGNVKVWPYSDFDNSDRLPVTLHKAKSRRKVLPFRGMNDSSSSNMTIIQSAEHSAEMPENRMVKKYHSSSVMPTDNSDKSVVQTHADSIKTVLLQDANGNMVSEEELAKILPKIAENIAKMDTIDAEEILPGITQSVTKLRNGGNLVITTMTRKLGEVESDSSGRGSPEPSHPVLNVDDLDNSKIYLVEDSNGELFYVEDITSETQESAYFSSSRNTSESVSDGANSPTFKRISKIQQVGDSGINSSIAQEILSAMYNGDNVQEMTENEEEWSERTYEYDLPRRRNNEQTKGYSKDSFNTSYVVEEPDTIPRTKTTTKDRYETSYEMAEQEPWLTDGGQMQSYSQATQLQGMDRTDGASTVDTTDYSMRFNTRQNTGGTRTQESYTVEAEANVYPMVPYQYPVIQPPVFLPPAPVCIPAESPQYSLVKVDMKPQKEESVTSRVDVTENNKVIEIDERPIFKTVAHIHTGDKQPPVKKDMTEKKKYKIISSKASNVNEEEQESHMSFGELDFRYTAENVEIKKSPTLQTKQFFIRDSSQIEQRKQELKSEQRFRSEKTIDLGVKKPASARNNTTTIEVKRDYPMNDVETYEERTYSYDQVKTSIEPVEPTDTNMRVIRGSYLIKNNLEEVDVALDDNINMFDGNFVLSKENPLYQSDEDIYKKFEREKAEHAQKQDRFQRDYRQDLTFETVDKFSKSKNVKREAAKPKQSVTELLLEKLSTIDRKDIHQRIDVKHHAEDIYGDPRFLHADGSSLRSRGTNDFDTVGEKVDLLLKEGKAFITVKVTAERITPVDLEFNVWRKNQAIVTRIIEVDLLATEQRRRLYYKVMDEQNDSPRGSARRGYLAGPNETVLDGHQTLDLFSRILGAAEGEGDKEDITVKTKLTNTTRPFSSGMDLLY